MSERDQFCCVCCESLQSQKEAYAVFRTGFFRSIHPLGYCKTCHGMHLDAGSGMTAESPVPLGGDAEDAAAGIAAHSHARYDKTYPPAVPFSMVVSL